MGNVNGKLEDGPALYLRDQSRCMHPVLSFLRVATSLGNPFHPFLSLPPLRIFSLCAFPLTLSLFFFSVYRFTGNNEYTEASHLENYPQLFPLFQDYCEERPRR